MRRGGVELGEGGRAWPRSATRVVACLGASAALYALALPPHDLAPLAWVALVPWLATLDGRPFRAALLSWGGGALAMMGTFAWIFVADGFGLRHFAGLAAVFGLPYALFGLAVGGGRRLGLPLVVVAPPAWVAAELLRGNALGFLSLPWAYLAHSQYRTPETIQLASIGGTYAISFVIALVNAAIVDTSRSWADGAGRVARLAPATVACVALGGVLAHGRAALDVDTPARSQRIALVQTAIEDGKWLPENHERSVSRHEELTREVLARGTVDLVIWPESAIPAQLNVKKSVLSRAQRFSREVDTPLVVGTAWATRGPEEGSRRAANAAVLVRPDRATVSTYLKQRLFPFGEFLPLPAITRSIVSREQDLAPGDGPHALELASGLRIAPAVCWEIGFPELVRELVAQDVDLLVTISNDGRFGRSGGPHQHAALAVFRAVEHGISVARCANTGISLAVDPRGRVVAEVKDDRGERLEVAGAVAATLPVGRTRTFYSRHGDRLAHASVAVAAALGIAGLGTGIRRRRSPPIEPAGATRTRTEQEPALVGAGSGRSSWDTEREGPNDA